MRPICPGRYRNQEGAAMSNMLYIEPSSAPCAACGIDTVNRWGRGVYQTPLCKACWHEIDTLSAWLRPKALYEVLHYPAVALDGLSPLAWVRIHGWEALRTHYRHVFEYGVTQ